MEKAKKKRRWISLSILTLLFVGIGVAWFCLWFFDWRFYVSTDDAYVHGNIIPISSQTIAPATQIYAKEGDLVQEGDLLIQLDPTAAEAQFESAKGGLAAAVRNYSQLKEQAEAARETLKIKQAQQDLAHYTFFHMSNLDGTGILPGAEIQNAQTNFEITQSGLLIARAQYAAVQAQIEGTTVSTHPLVQQAQGNVISAFLNLRHTKIYAPATGYIGQRAVQAGEIVMPGKSLFNVIPLDQIWVEANYKEDDLRHIGIGQEVKLYSDLYGKSVHFTGYVRSVAPGTGSVFSFLPAQNATGNWIKVVQRVPVLIELDKVELIEHPLLLGLSMHSTVDIHDD